MQSSNRVVVGVTGATGQLYAIKALEFLANADVETHLVLSDAAGLNIRQESEYTVEDVRSLADYVHDNRNIGAPTASGSFRTRGMLVTPCSMKTLSNIAHGNSTNLIARSADVALKERRPLVLMPREKPFNRIHLKNMLDATDAGAIVMPPLPSFYNRPASIEEMVARTIARTLTYFDVDVAFDEWDGISSVADSESNGGGDGD
ncbi:UbiX family flavin prenyltransferase [Halogeometricum luteum]|uniref:Flavin prenyltransferase UbiX n=1 Tax=Halogeometricum luteum TaxID=2950537 RepID=A0ABU2G291_9EURY|nr:UbiX family flavin prenyltransferase [Halogeometricum sp. S3BR5-2]MDS0294912.1 UbiX family flavin prenyltransferase [Halogeometricum sp. S3BR5-2]